MCTLATAGTIKKCSITDTQIKRLQSVQNIAARLVSGARRRNHISSVLRSLHWLLVRRKFVFKTAVLVWTRIHGVAPPYLQEFCEPVEKVQGRPRLRSASTGCVDLPRVRTSVGQRSFAFQGPTVWNSLPSALRDSSLSVNVSAAAEDSSVSRNSHERHPAPLRRFFAILAPGINMS